MLMLTDVWRGSADQNTREFIIKMEDMFGKFWD